MYTVEEFDKNKTKVMEYILYKKRTEQEVRQKFKGVIDENMLEDIIEYVKEAGYINDEEYVKKLFNEYMTLKSMSIKELKNKVYSKGIDMNYIEDYMYENREILEEYEKNSAIKLIEKNKNSKDPQKLKMYLLSKGFNSDVLRKIDEEDE